MDRIKFIVEDYVDKEGGYRFPTINIYINNRNLIDLVSEIEQARWIRNGEEPKRSSYIGFETHRYDQFRSELFAAHKRPHSVLLTCTCTIEQCNCIMADISVQSETVIWSDIKSPWLGGKTPSRFIDIEEAARLKWRPIDYSEIGVFVFRRKPYVDAVNDLSRDWRIGKWLIKDSSRWER